MKTLAILTQNNVGPNNTNKTKILSKAVRKYINSGQNYNRKFIALLGCNYLSSGVVVQQRLLKRFIFLNIFRHLAKALDHYYENKKLFQTSLYTLNFYKGVRYSLSLPARGQRTHTNAHTARKVKIL